MRHKDGIKPIKQTQKFEGIKKDLFRLNKSFLENFKTYQINKFNILKEKEEMEEKIYHS